MTEMIYEYDGSFEGFLTCIFESYAQKEVLTAISCGCLLYTSDAADE